LSCFSFGPSKAHGGSGLVAGGGLRYSPPAITSLSAFPPTFVTSSGLFAMAHYRGARLILAFALFVSTAVWAAADDAAETAAEDEPILIVRAQSPPPPQLRIAGGQLLSSDPMYGAPAVPTYPATIVPAPAGPACPPALDPYVPCAP